MTTASLPPSVRFARLAGVSLVLGGLAVGGVASYLVQRFYVQETLHLTRQAVEEHMLVLFPRQVFEKPLTPETAGELERMVRAHFDLYRIRHAVLYDRQGRVAFSYDHDAYPAAPGAGAGGHAHGASAYPADYGDGAGARRPELKLFPPPLTPPEVLARTTFRPEQTSLVDAATGQTLRALRAFVPLAREHPLAAAEVYRDVGPMWSAIRTIQAALVGLLLVGGALLHLALRRVFNAAAAALRRQSMQLRAAFDEVRETYETTLAVLTSALDQRDSATQGHSVRVVAFARALAERLGLPGPELEHLLRGALLHDIGKIGVSDAILRKPARLTPEEWREMRRHAELGYQMLSGIPFLSGALPVVLYHHERWDGSGYPVGLQGRDIPLSARIFAVADVFDAMTSNRPYRDALGYQEARRHLVTERGRLYDPAVVDAFLEVPEAEWERLSTAAIAPRRSPEDLKSALGLRSDRTGAGEGAGGALGGTAQAAYADAAAADHSAG